jgi:hypothetical protein
LRQALRELAEEAPVVSELEEMSRRRRSILVPVLAAGIAAAVVLGVFFLAQNISPPSSAPASDPTKSIEVSALRLYPPYGIQFYTDLRSETPARITGTSLDPDVMADFSGYLWDSTVPDPEVGFDFVNIDSSKKIGLNFTFLPRCDITGSWDQVTVSVESDQGDFSQSVSTPKLPQLVEEWCARPLEVNVGSGSASANWCEVERDFEITNHSGRAVTVELTTSGWTAEPLVLEAGDYEGTMVVTSDKACRLPRDPTEFTLTYSDGTTERISGPTPTKNM